MDKKIEKYIESKKYSWSNTTKISEQSKLKSLGKNLKLCPEKLWEHLLASKAPYTRVTLWSRIVDFYKFIDLDKAKAYEKFRDENKLQFKDSYRRTPPEITFQEAKSRIDQMKHPSAKRKAMELLTSGMRYSESFTYDPETKTVLGKGSKRRRVFKQENELIEMHCSYTTLRMELKKVGIKSPHMLRKIRATDLAKKEVPLVDIMKIFGWSNLETAKSYLAAKEEDELEQIMNG